MKWSKLPPSEFYFAVFPNQFIVTGINITYVGIVPKIHFDEHGNLYPGCLGIDSILPSDMFEEMDGIHYTNMTSDQTRQALLNLEFKESEFLYECIMKGKLY